MIWAGDSPVRDRNFVKKYKRTTLNNSRIVIAGGRAGSSNAVSPGVIDTPWWDFLPAPARQQVFDDLSARVNTGRVGRPEEVAGGDPVYHGQWLYQWDHPPLSRRSELRFNEAVMSDFR
ncbi:MAG TPA: hypothetical protein VHC48_21515 [Puia sp.]|jgi:hypothetical protein|nr:hypothetical protein [Puia sp.]